VFPSNLPESLAGTVTLREQGWSRAFAVGLWTAAAVLLAAAVLVGRLAFAGASPEALSLPLAFAGGCLYGGRQAARASGGSGLVIGGW
jgi:ZIP family zinc transporter